MSLVTIRRAGPDDADAIAGIHVRGWQWGYRGLLPDELLAALVPAERVQRWRRQLEPDHATHTWVADAAQEPVGFVWYGPSQGAEDQAVGAVYALYIEERVKNTGVGRLLLAHATCELRTTMKCSRATLWVLAENARARRFYELAGWRTDGESRIEMRGPVALREVRYVIALP